MGGGGILPDYLMPPDTLSSLVQAVLRRNLDQRFIWRWFDRYGAQLRQRWAHQEETFVKVYQPGSAMRQDFYNFLEENGFHFGGAQDEPAVLRFTKERWQTDWEVLRTLLKAHLAVRLFGLRARYPVYHTTDTTLREAQRLWKQAAALDQRYKKRLRLLRD